MGKSLLRPREETISQAPANLDIDHQDWVACEIVAVGDRILATIEGRPVLDVNNLPGAPAGLFELRLDASEAAEILFRSFQVELDPEPTLLTVAAGMSRH